MSSDQAAAFPAVIRISNLCKTYMVYAKPHHRLLQFLARGKRSFHTSHVALKNVSFELHPGETLGIIGANGSGKSTLLQIIAGTLQPSSGSVEINGRVAALLELGAGFNPDFSGIDNIRLSGKLYGLSDAEIERKMDSIIDFSGIGNFVHQEVKTYSSGMFVRLAFSVIAHLDPKILIVDEALSVGDFIFQQKCAKYMRETLSGITKIIVSHDLGSIASMADRVLVLSKGELAYLGDPQTGIAVYQRIARASAEGREASNPDDTHSLAARAGAASAMDAADWLPIRDDQLSGTGRVTIDHAMWHVDTQPMAKTIKKTERLVLEFTFRADTPIDNPIIGYQIQDRHGLVIFGENTLSSSFPVASMGPGHYRTRLLLPWPQVAPGEYGITLGIGNGYNSAGHVVECWAHNIISISSIATDPVHGIFNNQIEEFHISKTDGQSS
jgi:ABC-type polysaccharide/polyol phosphate transport system ATPase subunit